MTDVALDTDRMDRVYVDWNKKMVERDDTTRTELAKSISRVEDLANQAAALKLDALFGPDDTCEDLPTMLSPKAEQHFLMALAQLEAATASLKLAAMETREASK